MTRSRGSLAGPLAIAAAAAGTTWVSTFSWRGLTEDSAEFLAPLLVLAAVVAGTGALTRWWRWPRPAVVAAQVVLSVMLACWILVGTPVPVGADWARLVALFEAAVTSANTYVAPVPDEVASVAPLFVAGGLGCLLLVDLLACTLRRVPLAGLPLLAVHSVALGVLDGELSWWVFAASGGGFLLMLFLHENEQIARWGRSLTPSSDGTVHRPGTGRSGAGVIGGSAMLLAVIVPLAIPTLSLNVFDVGPGGGGSSEIDLENPMTDLRRDLQQADDIPLLTVRTEDPTPSYLRIAVLNRFSAQRWTSGDRDIPTDNAPDGTMPALEGVPETVRRRLHDYTVQVTEEFHSSWLPTQAPISEIRAPGEWRYDTGTMDFISADTDLDTAGLSYTMTAVDLDRSAATMLAAPSGAGDVGREYVELPPDTPAVARDLAMTVTAAAPTRFEKAVALQNWFRADGGFTYSLDVDPGNGGNALVEFLAEDGRTGYCEQFASAMAVMARSLGIPARVAVGFLAPERTGPQTYEYSARDMHAWPELYIPGGGWTPFEPTPAARADSVPPYTRIDVGAGPGLPLPSPSASAGQDTPDRGDTAGPSAQPDPEQAVDSSDGASGFPWLRLGGGVLGAALVVAALLIPRLVRRARRARRLAGSPEEVWLELRDTVVDLGLSWPDARTPRETRDRLVEHGLAPERLAPVVAALEHARYAPPGTAGPAGLREAAEDCMDTLRQAAPRRAQRRADWWPRSVFAGRPVPAEAPVVERTPSGVVDHVG